MKTKVRVSSPPVEWILLLQHMAYVQWKGKKLGLVVSPGGDRYRLLALETEGTNEYEVLELHAHEYLGSFRALILAQRRGERYARAWLKRQQRADPFSLPPCECKPISKKSKKKGSR